MWNRAPDVYWSWFANSCKRRCVGGELLLLGVRWPKAPIRIKGVEGGQSTDDHLFNRRGLRSVFGLLPSLVPKRIDELGTAPPEACSHGTDLAAGVLDRRLERPAGVEGNGGLVRLSVRQDEAGDVECLVRPVRHSLVPQHPEEMRYRGRCGLVAVQDSHLTGAGERHHQYARRRHYPFRVADGLGGHRVGGLVITPDGSHQGQSGEDVSA